MDKYQLLANMMSGLIGALIVLSFDILKFLRTRRNEMKSLTGSKLETLMEQINEIDSFGGTLKEEIRHITNNKNYKISLKKYGDIPLKKAMTLADIYAPTLSEKLKDIHDIWGIILVPLYNSSRDMNIQITEYDFTNILNAIESLKINIRVIKKDLIELIHKSYL